MLVLNISRPTTPATSIAMTRTANGVRAAWVRPIARRGGTTVRRARSTAASAKRGTRVRAPSFAAVIRVLMLRCLPGWWLAGCC